MIHKLAIMNKENYKKRIKELFDFDYDITGRTNKPFPAVKEGYESYLDFILRKNEVSSLEDIKIVIALALEFLKHDEFYSLFSIWYEILENELIVSIVID